MKPSVRSLAVLALAGASGAFAQDYPNRPIKIVLPWPPALRRKAGAAEVARGQRVLSGAAKYLAGRFFKALEKHIDDTRKEASDATAA
jgi:hypothetical protein